MKKEQLPEPHFSVWHTLQSLENGQRILKKELMKRCRITHERHLYSVIEDLRNQLFFVVGSKDKDNGGYFEARDEDDVMAMLSSMRKPAITQLELADKMEQEWLRRQYIPEGVAE